MMHQYVDRRTGELLDESPFGDRLLRMILPTHSEDPARLYRLLTSARWPTQALAWMNYDSFLSRAFPWSRAFLEQRGVSAEECLYWPPRTIRGFFERQIRFWDCRPMSEEVETVVSPSDARILVGNLGKMSALFLKGKFFSLAELLGEERSWVYRFQNGDFSVLRLTPEKYHYNHVPVSGKVLSRSTIEGGFHSCHPAAQTIVPGILSKNRRVVTIIDTNVDEGSNVGLVAMVEIVALMIGRIQSCYSENYYDRPQEVREGMELRRGSPMSLFRPGSSTVVLIFEPGKIEFSADILENMSRNGRSIFTERFERPLIETEVEVRQEIARKRKSL